MSTKTTTKTGANPLGEMAAVVADSPRLRKRVESMCDALLDNVERTIRIGDPQAIAVYSRQVIPHLLKAMSEGQASAREQAQRDAIGRIMGMLGGQE